ncbi:hypothetical protein JZ751_014160 [Albula glossodonta]|uniref:KY-like immunoglobulin-like domain-containing protein n=1 Tax=Albula glossodonta TaxID=121402 RepID=A0A8T2NVQ1_9TELE|nr:hypothetical protein JZ751_014160 [Albula glossodonta]
MKIDLDKLKHIDNYASKVRPKNTVEALVQELLKGANTDIEKLRAIWMWVTHHIGVECREVSGYSKGGQYKLGKRFSGDPTHAWNAVRLNGSWHLLDSTWGAGKTNQNSSKFTFKYDEFYFLTHPALFVGDHFPQDPEWQLLKPRLSLKQFEDAIHRKSCFYNMGLLSSQPETSLIQSDGRTTITVQTSSPVLFTYNLNGNETSGIMTLRPNGMKLDVYPESTGLHSLEIYAKAPDAEEEESYSMVCEYQLQCRAVSREMKIPHNLINPVGPSWATERKGLQEPSQREPIVHTKDGRCSFRFRVPTCLNLMAMLKTTVFSMTDNEQRRHIFRSRQGSWVEFKVQVPQAAMYVFSVYGKDKAEAGSYGYICNYLISCTNPRVRWPLYPLTYATWKEDYELVEPLVGVLPVNRSVQFKMRIPDVSQVSVEGRETRNLSLGADGYWSGSCSTAGCRDLNVMIKVKPHDRSLSFILNYQVEIQ